MFQKEVRPRCTPFEYMRHKAVTEAIESVRDMIKTIPECAHLAERATSFEEKKSPKTCREPFGTIMHSDLWVNNIMNKIDENGKIHNVFVDFQLYDYQSSASDVIFFLWTSVDESVLEQHLDHLLQHYHQNLVDILRGFGLDTSPFDYEKFTEELRLAADYEFGHSFIFKFIFLKNIKHGIKETIHFDFENIPELKKSLKFMISVCEKRGWMY